MATQMKKVEQEQTKVEVASRVSAERQQELTEKAAGKIEKMLTLKEGSKQLEEYKKWAATAGYDELEQISGSSKFLQKKSKEIMNKENSKEIGKTISSLAEVSQSLTTPKGVMGTFKSLMSALPFVGTKMRENQTLEEQIQQIEEALTEYINDAAADEEELKNEIKKLGDSIYKLEELIFENKVGINIIQEALPQLEQVAPRKAEIIKEEILLEMVKRQAFLQQHLSVSFEALAAFKVVREQNKETASQLDQAKQSTLQAFRTSATVTAAIASQQEKIEFIQNLRDAHERVREENQKNLATTTDNLIKLADNPISDPEKTMQHVQSSIATLKKLETAKLNRIGLLSTQIEKVEVANEMLAQMLEKDEEALTDATQALSDIISKKRGETVTVEEKPQAPEGATPKKTRKPKASST